MTLNIKSQEVIPLHNPIENKIEVKVFVVTSKRFAKNPGTVVNPPFKYLGNKKSAVTTIAIAARVSHTITDKPLWYADPFRPTICSVDRLVSKRDPAITPAVKLLPPRKYPSEEVSLIFLVFKIGYDSY